MMDLVKRACVEQNSITYALVFHLVIDCLNISRVPKGSWPSRRFFAMSQCICLMNKFSLLLAH